jgi:hypothetical protein
MENLKSSAVESLKAEEYDANQVQMAYEGVKRKVGNLEDCREAAAVAAKTYEDACITARSAEERLSEAFKACDRQLAIVDDEGHAVGENGIVDVPVEGLRKLQSAVADLRKSLDTMAIRQAELECADDDLDETYARLTEAGVELAHARARCASNSGPCRAADRNYKSWEKKIKSAESLQAKQQQLAETAWEEMSQFVQSIHEAGIAFVESFQPNEVKNPLMGAVRSVQQSARASFRQISSSAIAVRRAREGWLKAATQRRKTVQKQSASTLAHAEIVAAT